MYRSGTEEEFTELNQLLEDIYIFRRDTEELEKKEKENKKLKDKADREKGEQMREAAMMGMASELFCSLSLNYLYIKY